MIDGASPQEDAIGHSQGNKEQGGRRRKWIKIEER